MMATDYEFPHARLLIFAKAPVPGRVKTRLIGRYGPRGAAVLYTSLLQRTLTLANATALCPVELWCAPDCHHGFFTTCRRRYRITLARQQGADLGRRMHHALTTALRRSPYAVLIGGDCSSLTVADLRMALRALANGGDAVLGPAEDGGYVLIGLHRPVPALFQRMAWGTSGVLAATRRRLRRAGLDWVEIGLQWDIDRPADVKRLRGTGSV